MNLDVGSFPDIIKQISSLSEEIRKEFRIVTKAHLAQSQV